MNSRSSPKFQDQPAKRRRRSHIFSRALHDHYLEPEWVDVGLFRSEKFDRRRLLTDACCGIGRVAEAAKAAGYKVEACDIVDRGYPGTKVADFLKRTAPTTQVACNPPFNAVEAFARHALLDLGATKIALICPVARLNAARWLKELPLRRVLLLSPRPSMPPAYVILRGEKPKGGRMDFCWLIFERGHNGPAEVGWLHRDGNKGENGK
jgi:hypothetical protein